MRKPRTPKPITGNLTNSPIRVFDGDKLAAVLTGNSNGLTVRPEADYQLVEVKVSATMKRKEKTEAKP